MIEKITDGTEAFWYMVNAGRALMNAHVNYEQATPYPLEKRWKLGVAPSYYVAKMKLSADRRSLVVNESLTLSGIPPIVFEYRLGDRCALEWIIDQHQVSIDKRSGIVSNPNRDDDEEYIVRLVCQVITVSVETAQHVNEMPLRVPWDGFEWRGIGNDDSGDLSSFWNR
jgi:predicted helicase